MKKPQRTKICQNYITYLLSKKFKNKFFFVKNTRKLVLGGSGLKTPRKSKNMPKLGHYLPFEQTIQKWNFFVEKPKKLVLGGSGIEKSQRTNNMPKLGHYLHFEQKIQKYNSFVEKPKNLYFRGPNPKKSENHPFCFSNCFKIYFPLISLPW